MIGYSNLTRTVLLPPEQSTNFKHGELWFGVKFPDVFDPEQGGGLIVGASCCCLGDNLRGNRRRNKAEFAGRRVGGLALAVELPHDVLGQEWLPE